MNFAFHSNPNAAGQPENQLSDTSTMHDPSSIVSASNNNHMPNLTSPELSDLSAGVRGHTNQSVQHHQPLDSRPQTSCSDTAAAYPRPPSRTQMEMGMGVGMATGGHNIQNPPLPSPSQPSHSSSHFLQQQQQHPQQYQHQYPHHGAGPNNSVDPGSRASCTRADSMPSSSTSNYNAQSQPSAERGGGGGNGGTGGYHQPDPSNRPGQGGYPDQQTVRPSHSHHPPQDSKNTSVVIKVGMVGDAQIGKTSLMVKYVEGSWDEDYIQTLGVNFMEKTISIRNTEITFSIWDLGGQREFVNMLPLVCNDAVAILFMFDLTRKSTLNSIKEWYRQGRGFNKTAIPFLVGTKYDHFVNFPREEQEEISNQAKRFAKAMKASLIFSSTSHSINVQKIFKIVLSKAFDLRCTIPEIENVGEPLLLYKNI